MLYFIPIQELTETVVSHPTMSFLFRYKLFEVNHNRIIVSRVMISNCICIYLFVKTFITFIFKYFDVRCKSF